MPRAVRTSEFAMSHPAEGEATTDLADLSRVLGARAPKGCLSTSRSKAAPEPSLRCSNSCSNPARTLTRSRGMASLHAPNSILLVPPSHDSGSSQQALRGIWAHHIPTHPGSVPRAVTRDRQATDFGPWHDGRRGERPVRGFQQPSAADRQAVLDGQAHRWRPATSSHAGGSCTLASGRVPAPGAGVA